MKKTSNKPGEISYHTMDLVPFHSSHYPVSEYSDSDDYPLVCGKALAITADIPL